MNYYYSEEYQEKRKQIGEQVFQESNLKESKITGLGDGYTVRRYYYADTEHQKPGWAPVDGLICRLYRGEKMIFEWKNTDGCSRLIEIIEHSNGRKYLIFDEDLYGYSVLDIEAGECARYFPDESFYRDDSSFTETFIWCEAFYDRESDLLAVDGCYWACPGSMIVIDFSDPMKIKEASEWYEIIDDINDKDVEFREWKSDCLVCSTVTVSKQDIMSALK